MDNALLEEKELALDTEVTALAKNRQAEAKNKSSVKFWEDELEAYLAEFPNAGNLKVAKEVHADQVQTTNEIDARVREKTLQLYGLSGNKTVYAGVSVAEHATFAVDNEKAIDWAAEHHHKGLKLNLAEIKKVAKAGMEVDGVVIGTENRVRIASDLSEYL